MANIQHIDHPKSPDNLGEIYECLMAKEGKISALYRTLIIHPESILAILELNMAIMFSKSPLSRQQREMIAVIVSSENGCAYSLFHHAETLNEFWQNEDRIERLRMDFYSAGLSGKDTALCQFAVDLTLHPDGFPDRNSFKIKQLNAEGFSDRSILDAALCISYINFENRLVMALQLEIEIIEEIAVKS